MNGTSENRKSPSVDYVACHWQTLPPHIREAIVTLVDAGSQQAETPAHRHDESAGGTR